jgi:hypothetical protein
MFGRFTVLELLLTNWNHSVVEYSGRHRLQGDFELQFRELYYQKVKTPNFVAGGGSCVGDRGERGGLSWARGRQRGRRGCREQLELRRWRHRGRVPRDGWPGVPSARAPPRRASARSCTRPGARGSSLPYGEPHRASQAASAQSEPSNRQRRTRGTQTQDPIARCHEGVRTGARVCPMRTDFFPHLIIPPVTFT